MTHQNTQLQEDSLGTAESIIMGVAGTAPAFSIAATTATLAAAVGTLAPASLLYCGLIMFGVTFSYMHLNRINPNAGASYAWGLAPFRLPPPRCCCSSPRLPTIPRWSPLPL